MVFLSLSFFLVLTHNIYNWISFLFLLCYMYVIVMIVSWLEGSCKYNQRYNSHIHDDDDEDHVSIDDGINKWIFKPKKKNKIAASVDWELKKLLKKKFFKYHHQYDWSLLKKISKIHCVCVCVFVIWWGQMNERKKIFGDNKFCFLVIKIAATEISLWCLQIRKKNCFTFSTFMIQNMFSFENKEWKKKSTTWTNQNLNHFALSIKQTYDKKNFFFLTFTTKIWFSKIDQLDSVFFS